MAITMRPKSFLGTVPFALAIVTLLAGCHGRGTGGATSGGGTIPVILTFHDTPPSNIAVTSFEVTITGAVLQPGNVSLLSAPGQTVELSQLQTNSTFLSTTNVATGTYNSLTLTYSNPHYTIFNNSGTSLTIFGKTCGVLQSCVVTPTVSGSLTETISSSPFPVILGSSSQALLEADVDLNTIIQSDFSVDFSASGAVTANLQQVSSGTVVIGSLTLSGAITTVVSSPSQSFTLTPPTGPPFTIGVTNSTQFAQFNQSSRKSTCTANNFSCLATSQIVDVQLQILGDGSFQAAEVDFDDAASTQQVSGTIVALIGATPPTGFQMVVHNTVPPLASLPVGTPVTVTVGTGATFVINDGLFVLPSGSFNFGAATDLLVGQEVEARASGMVTAGPPPTFTADRFALEETQFNGTVTSVSSPNFLVNFMNLPTIFTSPVTQIQVVTTNQTLFQTPNQNFNPDVSNLVSIPGGVFVGGFLFNSGVSNTPNIAAVTVRAKVSGT
jgi:hypothetical protein